MNKQELMVKVAAVITAADDCNGGPESLFYIFFDMNMDAWSTVRDMLVRGGLIQIKNHFVTLTAKGKETAIELNKAIERNKK